MLQGRAVIETRWKYPIVNGSEPSQAAVETATSDASRVAAAGKEASWRGQKTFRKKRVRPKWSGKHRSEWP